MTRNTPHFLDNEPAAMRDQAGAADQKMLSPSARLSDLEDLSLIRTEEPVAPKNMHVQAHNSISELLDALKTFLDERNERVAITKSEEPAAPVNSIANIGTSANESLKGIQASLNKLNQQLGIKKTEEANMVAQIGSTTKESFRGFQCSLDKLNARLGVQNIAEAARQADISGLRAQILENALALFPILAKNKYDDRLRDHSFHSSNTPPVPHLHLVTIGDDGDKSSHILFEDHSDERGKVVFLAGLVMPSTLEAMETLLELTESLLRKSWAKSFYHPRHLRGFDVVDGGRYFAVEEV